MLRAIDEIRPAWVVGENVTGITTMVEGGVLTDMGCSLSLFQEGDDVHRYELDQSFTIERICRDLERIGYSVQPVLVPAAAVGAPHRRDRVFIIASENTMHNGCCIGADGKQGSERDERNVSTGDQERICGEARLDAPNSPCDGSCGISGEQGSKTSGQDGKLYAESVEAATEIATNKLQFDSDDYIDLEAITYGISQLPDKPATKRPSTRSLSVNGKVINDRMDKYLAHAGESSSALKEALKSPKHYLIYKNENLKPKDESHFTLGTFIHSAFLEPTKFAKVKVLPEAAKNTIEGLQTLIKFYCETLSMEPEDLSRMNAKDLRSLLSIYENRAAEDGYTFIKKEDYDIVSVIRSSYMTYAGGILLATFGLGSKSGNSNHVLISLFQNFYFVLTRYFCA